MDKIIIGIVGEIGAGKTTLAKYLEKVYNAKLLSFSGMLRDILNRLYLEESRPNIQTLSTILRQNFSEDLMSKVIMKDVKQARESLIVTEAIRRPSDTAYLKRLPNFYTILIQADAKVRYKRLTARSENTDDQNTTWENFKKQSQQESEQKIRGIAKQTNFAIDNNGTLKKLYKQINEIMRSIMKYET